MNPRGLPYALAIALATATPTLADVTFDDYFVDETMRLDYYHTGSVSDEIFSLDRVVSDGAWAGSRTRLVDDLNLGAYHFAVYDLESNRMLYSRGYSSIFGEWVTIPEAKERHRTFHESLRFPWPKTPVRVVVSSRNAENHFEPVWSLTVDPAARAVNPVERPPVGEVISIFENGPPAEKVDLLILGEGYAENERDKLLADAERMVEALFAVEPFASRKGDFNVRALFVGEATSGVSRPRAGQYRRTTTSTRYNVFDSERYVLSMDNRALREVASAAPYEFIEILVNEAQYGGGGIFFDHSTASVDTGYASYIMIHEFGHHFADLGDEYYTSSVAYETGGAEFPEPWPPNITADGESPKWADMVTEGTPLPTPWDKTTYEARMAEYQARRAELRAQGVEEPVMDAFFDEVKAWSTEFLGSQEHAGEVGAFEGASYEPVGLYRPEVDCIMFTRDDVGFCSVCSRGIERVIDLYSRP